MTWAKETVVLGNRLITRILCIETKSFNSTCTIRALAKYGLEPPHLNGYSPNNIAKISVKVFEKPVILFFANRYCVVWKVKDIFKVELLQISSVRAGEWCGALLSQVSLPHRPHLAGLSRPRRCNLHKIAPGYRSISWNSHSRPCDRCRRMNSSAFPRIPWNKRDKFMKERFIKFVTNTC